MQNQLILILFSRFCELLVIFDHFLPSVRIFKWDDFVFIFVGFLSKFMQVLVSVEVFLPSKKHKEPKRSTLVKLYNQDPSWLLLFHGFPTSGRP